MRRAQSTAPRGNERSAAHQGTALIVAINRIVAEPAQEQVGPRLDSE